MIFSTTISVVFLAILFVSVSSSENESEENCEKIGILFYEDIGCKPVKFSSTKCPMEYNCDLTKAKSGCTFKGETYPAGTKIPMSLTYSACMAACTCIDVNITCASVDCPEFFLPQLNADCYAQYELDQCCLKSIICKNTTQPSPKTCNVDGKLYRLGEQFQPKDQCLSCVCHENFTGTLDTRTCSRMNCAIELFQQSKIQRKCAPTYLRIIQNDDGILCCPNHWICPDDVKGVNITNTLAKSDSTNSTVNNDYGRTDLTCSFGERTLKYGEGFAHMVTKYDKDRKVRCECIIPPFLTCKEVD